MKLSSLTNEISIQIKKGVIITGIIKKSIKHTLLPELLLIRCVEINKAAGRYQIEKEKEKERSRKYPGIHGR